MSSKVPLAGSASDGTKIWKICCLGVLSPNFLDGADESRITHLDPYIPKGLSSTVTCYLQEVLHVQRIVECGRS